MFRKIITYLTIYSFMFSNVCWAAMITPDGRTQTTVNVNGHVYDVTTSTVSGQNAFNSFSNFDVYKGTTVNLYLPGSTLNLINLVRDGDQVRAGGRPADQSGRRHFRQRQNQSA